MKETDKRIIDALVCATMRECFPDGWRQRCVFASQAGARLITEALGVRAILQAGTMFWPKTQVDDGKSDTHFGYEFQVDQFDAGVRQVLAGTMPEIHVWIALPEEKVIVDFSTRWMPDNCRTLGQEWPGEHPPPFLWAGADDLPSGVLYKPHAKAIALALLMLEKQPIQGGLSCHRI